MLFVVAPDVDVPMQYIYTNEPRQAKLYTKTFFHTTWTINKELMCKNRVIKKIGLKSKIATSTQLDKCTQSNNSIALVNLSYRIHKEHIMYYEIVVN